MSKGKILVVDGDFDIRRMLQIYLSGQGYEITAKASIVGSGLSPILPDLLIHGFEKWNDGDEVLISFFRMEGIPFILLFQREEKWNDIVGQLEIPPPYNELIKPFDIEELYQMVDRLLRESRMQK